MLRPVRTMVKLLPLAALIACDKSGGSVGCGIDAFTGPLVVKESFGKGAALATVPADMPASLPIRLVAGPAWRGTLESALKGGWRVTLHGTVAREAHIGYGVLIVDFSDHPLGVMAFDAQTIRNATSLGQLVVGDSTVPLLGVRVDPTSFQNAKCPVFPDSLR